MMKKKKVALLAVSGLVITSLVVGGASFALFTSSTTNSGNSFTAGTLKISSYRDDVPNVGPMFYTDTTSLPGTLATGVWAPGDKVTRGLFLENNGSLAAKLKTLTATTADSGGNAVSSGAYFDGDNAFAGHAKLKIWQVQWFDPAGNLIPWLKLDSSTMDAIMDYVNQGYAAWAVANPGADPSTDPNVIDQIVEFVNQYLWDHINDIKGAGNTINDGVVKVTKLYNDPMADVVNKTLNVSKFGISTAPGQATLLAFTVEFNQDTGNDMQGASAYFNFGSYWEQAAHN